MTVYEKREPSHAILHQCIHDRINSFPASVSIADQTIPGFQDSTEDDAESLIVDEWAFHGTPYLRDETTNKIYATEFRFQFVIEPGAVNVRVEIVSGPHLDIGSVYSIRQPSL